MLDSMDRNIRIKSKVPGLTKSKVMTGIQCEKALYLTVHQPELAPETSQSQQAIFDQGHVVGLEAQKQFPGGALIDVPRWELGKALELTQKAIASGATTIYEATFAHAGVLVRVDILHRDSAKKSWRLVEVKSSTSVKEEHLSDLAIQSWVLRGAGIKHDRAILMCLNNQCIYPDLDNLFKLADCTEEIQPLIASLEKKIKALQKVVSGRHAPDREIGPHCSTPYDCAFREHCWKEKRIPALSVLDLPGSSAKKWALYDEGILKLTDSRIRIDDFKGAARKMLEAAKTKKRWIAKEGLSEFLEKIQYPLYYLDFETSAYAIPKFNGTRPYQAIPFQFSVHVEDGKGGKPRHREFLHSDGTDPRPPLIQALLDAIGTRGSVVSYNMGFEEGRIRELAAAFPKFKKPLLAICDRLVDPLPVFRAHVYDPKFEGSFSIKAVAPALIGAGLSYAELEVGDGGAASLAFAELIASDTAPDRKSELRMALLAYCKQDTEAMVELMRWINGQI